MKTLITGTAGFIGYHLANRLTAAGHEVCGLDCINEYYDVKLKHDRLEEAGIGKNEIGYGKKVLSKKMGNYSFIQLKLEDREALEKLFRAEKFDLVVNLAAQAGVRYSLTNPYAYLNSNMAGFLNILEQCRHSQVGHLVYASSSSVYGLNEQMPFTTHDNVDHPISLYAASKKSNELMAHTYSHLYGLPSTGLRFFTVYGPWGRPDMALFLFTKAILEDKPIDVFNNGDMKRDFTYVDDIVSGIEKISAKPAQANPDWEGVSPDPSSSPAPYRIYNIGNSSPVHLMDFIRAIEECLGKEAKKNFMPLQAGDVPATWADVGGLANDFNYQPSTPVKTGVQKFIEWYRGYYKV